VLSGAELLLSDLAASYGHSCKVVLFADGPFRERLEKAGVEVEVLPAPPAVKDIRRQAGGLRELRAAPGVLHLSRRLARVARSYDVLYANSQKALVVGALAGKLAGKPVMWHLHDMLTTDHFSPKHQWLAVTIANRMVARVIANSEATALEFAKSGGEPKLVHVVYNGIDAGPMESVDPEEVAELKEKLGLAGIPVVGTFSRLAPWKGQHVLIEALTRLPGFHALIVGEALFGEYAYARSLDDQSRALGVANRVHRLGFREDIPRLMKLTDVVAHTSIAAEPFGRVIVEGMLARKPVLASRAGGVMEIVEDGMNGVLVPPEDSNALAAALANLVANPSKGRALAEAGYETALERFSLRTMTESIEKQIWDVAGFAGLASVPL
jgi:glycosyltransferase involved in cell wall biosynthesis